MKSELASCSIMSKHFRSILRLVSDDGDAPATLGGEKLSIGFSSSSKTTVTFPEQPRPPFTQAPTEYSFDGVFSEKQSSVYKDSVREIVDNVLAGYNGAVISMATQDAHQIRTETMSAPKRGAILKASQQIFRRLMKSRKKQAQACSNLVVLCSLVVVINESVHDLLAGFSSAGSHHKMSQEDNTISPKLSLAEEGYLVGASQQEVQGTVKMASLLQYGVDMEKKVLEAYRNEEGNTKTVHHTMCTISVEYAQFGTMNAPISGSLSFVEVCPSDLLSCTSKESVSLRTFVEAVKSLTKNVPTTLSADFATEKSLKTLDICKKSVLTQLLKEALGGNCKTLLLTFAKKQFLTENYSKILSVLELASRARLIGNNPNRKDIAEKALMNAYMRELHDMYGEGVGSAAEGEKKIVLKPVDKSHTDLPDSGKDERQHNMEMAAFALVTAIEGGGEVGDSDSCSEDDLDSLSKSVIQQQQKCAGGTRPRSTKVKIRRRKTRTELGSAESASSCDDDIGVEALITILQDPDTGAPRPSVAALDNVKLRPDAGAIFSGAAIVCWLMESVAGVETEEQAVCLGELLLTRGALVHSEGSMVFANAESLFYYAKEGRPNRRTLSQQEIQSLLAQARTAMATEVTAVERSHDKGSKEKLHNIHKVDNIGKDELDSSIHLQSKANRKSTTPKLHEIYNCVDGESGEMQLLNTGTIESVVSINSECSMSSSYLTTPLSSSYPTTPLSSSYPTTSSEREFSISGSVGDMSSLPGSTDGAMEGPLPLEGHKSVGFQEDKSGGVDEETSDPYTAPVDCLPTVQTLENTVNYPHPIHGAVAIGKRPGVVRELVMMFGVNKEDDYKRTPLMFAALGNNRRSSVSTLLECGADVNRQDISGLTALHVACYHGNKAAANVLLNKGAVIDILDAKGHSAFHWSMVPEIHSCLQLLLRHASASVLRAADSGGLTALHWAIHFKRPHHLALLLKKYGNPVHLDKEGRSLVTYALQKESLECMKVMISAHPPLLTFPDITESTPLHHASAHPSPHPLLYLLSHKTMSSPLLINVTNSYQRTPLHCAVAYNSVYNTDLLLRRGADVQLCDNEGKTPIDYAKELENGEDMLAILEGQASFEWTEVESSRPQELKELNDLVPAVSRFCTIS